MSQFDSGLTIWDSKSFKFIEKIGPVSDWELTSWFAWFGGRRFEPFFLILEIAIFLATPDPGGRTPADLYWALLMEAWKNA